jgi:hypothetical protein
MKGLAIAVLVLFFFFSVAQGADGPGIQPRKGQAPPPASGGLPAGRFYGYVPPPPIHHTWPGGYRAIFMEMMNTWSEHMLGRY